MAWMILTLSLHSPQTWSATKFVLRRDPRAVSHLPYFCLIAPAPMLLCWLWSRPATAQVTPAATSTCACVKGQAPGGHHSWSEGPLWESPLTSLASVSSSFIWWSLYPLPQIIMRTRDKAHKAVLDKGEGLYNQEWYVLCLSYYDHLCICLSSLDPYVILNGKKLPLGLFT